MIKYGPQNVVAYFGDAIGDFPSSKEPDFPSNNFVFPNPMYGKWQKMKLLFFFPILIITNTLFRCCC